MSDDSQSSSFYIRGMDCAEEVAVLKRAVGPLVGGEENLSFDALRGKMTILDLPRDVSAAQIVEAVSPTGMTATAWHGSAHGESAPPEPFWERRGRTLLCTSSGLLLLAAFTVHALGSGSLSAALRADHETVPIAALLLYLAAMVTGAWFVVPKAIYAARSLRPDMNLLMVIAVIGAAGIGEWFEAATVSFLFSMALLLERWSVGRARRAIGSLLELSPDLARVVDPDSDRTTAIPVAEVPIGTQVRVRAGDRIPLDGEILKGRTDVNQSAITGESMPVDKQEGDEVFAGTVNGAGTIDIEVTKATGDTTLAKIIKLVEEAQARRSPSEQWVERFARYYTPIMMALAVGVAILPALAVGGWGVWFYRALVLLVIACPCALVISTPVSVVAGLASSARAGVLVKGGSYLEAPARLQAIAFDKTGTLTLGRPSVQRVIPFNDHTEEGLLATAASLEAESNHPLARAIVVAAESAGVSFEPARSLTMIAGKGAEGEIGDRRFWIGSHRLMEEKGAETPEFHRLAEEMEDSGHSLIALGDDSHICGLIGVADEIRPEATSALRELRSLGIENLVMLTGDNERTTAAVAAAVGVTDFAAELLPQDKVDAVARLGNESGAVAMVGDGVNDAPALAAADLGIAMGAAGTDAAIETADIALMSDDLRRLPWLILHSRQTLRIIRQNIFFALAVKAGFIVLAALGLATLWMAIAADMGASLLVIANALRLLR